MLVNNITNITNTTLSTDPVANGTPLYQILSQSYFFGIPSVAFFVAVVVLSGVACIVFFARC